MEKKSIVVTGVLMTLLTFAQAAEIVWLGSGDTWDNAQSWSGGVVPSCTDIAVFNDQSGDCIINHSIKIQGIQLADNYAGIVYQGNPSASSITVDVALGDDGLDLSGGTYIVSSVGVLYTQGHLYIDGGDFQSNGYGNVDIPKIEGISWEHFCDAVVFHRLETNSSGAYVDVPATDKKLNFVFDESYDIGLLQFKVYDHTRQTIWSSDVMPLVKKKGSNHMTLDFDLFSGTLNNGAFYYLEVYDKNNTKYFLKFRYNG